MSQIYNFNDVEYVLKNANIHNLSEVGRNIKVENVFKTNYYSYDHRNRRDDLNDKIEKLKNTFNKFEFKNSGLVVAGGYFSSYIVKDIDVFVVAKDEQESKNNIEKLLNHMKPKKIFVTKNCISFIQNSIPIQIVCRYFPTAQHVIADFDIAPACVYYDGFDIFMNDEAKFTYETGYIIVNTSRINCNFANRLQKYVNKGYGIILPFIDPNCKLEKLYLNDIIITLEESCIENVSIKTMMKYTTIPNEFEKLKVNEEINEYYSEIDFTSQKCIKNITTNMVLGINKVNMSTICGIYNYEEFMKVFKLPKIRIEIKPDSSLYEFVSIAECTKIFNIDEAKEITSKHVEYVFKQITYEEFDKYYKSRVSEKYDDNLIKISFPLKIEKYDSHENMKNRIKFQTNDVKFYGKYYYNP